MLCSYVSIAVSTTARIIQAGPGGITRIINMDYHIRVGAHSDPDTYMSLVVLFHLTEDAPDFAEPVPLYRGVLSDLRDDDTEAVICGFGGSQGWRNCGRVKIGTNYNRRIHLNADPSRLQLGDSGGPVFVKPHYSNDQWFVAATNWNIGYGSGGAALSSFDMDFGSGMWFPVRSKIERYIYDGADILPGNDFGVFKMTAVHSNQNLDVQGSSDNNEAAVVQNPDSSSNSQRWLFTKSVRNGEIFYQIRALHSYKCLDVPQSNQNGNVGLIQYTCHSTTNQQWRLVGTKLQTGEKVFEIQARHSYRCLTVHGAGVGAEVVQDTCHRKRNQKFFLTPA